MITVEGLFNEILQTIQSKMPFQIDFSPPRRMNAGASSAAANDAETRVTANFQDVLNQYMSSGNTDPTELGAAIDDAIVEAARRYQIDPNLIRAIIRQESNFNPTAVSHTAFQGNAVLCSQGA
jgi:soluble lytic murein transglycosylase-like protein